MKIFASKSDLLAGILRVSSIASRRTTLPILNCLKLEVIGDKLVIHATDLDSYARISVPVEVERAGSCVLNATTLVNLLQNSPSDTIVIDSDGDKATIERGDSEGEYPCYKVEDWTEVPAKEVLHSLLFSGPELREALATTAQFTHQDSTAEVGLSCVQVTADSNEITFIATNRKHLAQIKMAVRVEKPFEFLLPSTMASHLADFCGEGDVTLRVMPTRVEVQAADGSWACGALAQDSYPPAKNLVAGSLASNTVSIQLSTERLKLAVSTLQALSEMGRSTWCRGVASNGKVVISSPKSGGRINRHNETMGTTFHGEAKFSAVAESAGLILKQIEGPTVELLVNPDVRAPALVLRDPTVPSRVFICIQMKPEEPKEGE